MALRNVLMFSRKFSSVASSNISLKGIFIPLTTPFNENQEICFDSLGSNLKKYEELSISVAGSNGEGPYLNPDERVSIVKFVRQNSSKIVIGGSTLEATHATCALTTEMMNAGADAVLVMPPFYFKKRMTEEAVATHYTTIAESCGSPIVIYNMPMVTGIDISTNSLAKLAQHPLIRGVKDSDIRKCAMTVQDTRGLNFDVLIGSAGYLLGALLNGCSGGINGLAGLLGNELCNFYNCFQEGKIKEASTIQRRLSKLDILLLSQLGVPALKAAMDMMGLVGGTCRKPMCPSTEADKVIIRKYLQEAEVLL
uniref:4-hydroxy-2-oxoglutarate aldolase, mitochondrial n=1 Tax=Rhodnius prolixus TaxID=13249 RepID=T1I7R3_RHOPR